MAQDKLYQYEGFLGRIHRIRDQIRDHWSNQPGTDFSHISRSKTRQELVRISAAVMGIEFSYAAETAFVSPTLLKIGVKHQKMTLVWALSPLIGFFLTPILGSLSDRCKSNFGRRRPFILTLAIGVFLGLLLVPNGELLGYSFGDETSHHPYGVFFTVLGTVLLDFDADACQSPARAYLLDVTTAEDHARGLSTFTIMAGLGGFFGYALGAIDWDLTFVGALFGGHVRAVFALITVIFILCVGCTLTSFPEVPLWMLEGESGAKDQFLEGHRNSLIAPPPAGAASLLIYLRSIVLMPFSIRILCLTNLFCWMAHVCYSLYFTDFVGEAVFGGNPTAPSGRDLYESGVRFGCWGMSMYSLSCACYSTRIEGLIQRFGAKRVYIGGLLFYSGGMLLMALTRDKYSVIIFSWTAGVMYSTLFTMPYLLIANYHARGAFGEEIRGLGTDVAIVSSMVFLAQFILSLCMGTIISVTGTTTAVVSVASFLALCGAGAATQIVYFDL